MITAEHLSRSFSGNGLKLRDLNFHIEKGDCVGLIGPSGSGKRSLMRLILGIYNPDHGRLWVMGKNPSLICRTPLQMSRIDRNRMTFILPESLPDERVSEIVSPKKNAIFDADDFLKECFETLKLSALLSSKVHQLSRGELARVRFYEAITSMPELLLLYEPFVGVDAAMKEQMIRILLTMNQKYSTTILLAVQNLNDMDKICTRAIVLDKGICIYSGDLSDLRHRYLLSNRLVFQILDGVPDFQDLPIQRFSWNDGDLEITFDPESVRAADIIDHVLHTCNASEILIHEPQVEDLFRILYSSKKEDTL